MPAVAATGSTLKNVTENQKRWLVFGIALNKVLVSQIRTFVEQEVKKEYGNLQTTCHIHTQLTSARLRNWPTFLKYENINGNDVFPRLPGGRFDYSKFDCRVTSHVDFVKLYVENHMAKFNAFDEHCDASAVLALLVKVPVFSLAVQSAAGDVRRARNAWAHCAFSDWDLLSFQLRFAEMEKLVKSLGLSSADEMYLVNELNDWETKGAILCLNATINPDLVKMVQQDVNALKNDIDKMAFEEEVNREYVKKALHDSQLLLEELRERVDKLEHQQEVVKQEQEDVQQRVTYLENQQKSNQPQINYEIANCESDIAFLVARHDPATRQWLLKDFDKWFSDPGDSRAYVLLGDPGVGKSVMAGVLAQRSREAGHLGAAYFCRHNDNTRNDPRCLLGTIASHLCECSSEYNSIMGGVGGVAKMLGNSNLGVQELFTKLLQEPLYMCHSTQRTLVVIDALDETQYESREDFLDLIMNRFPLLPNWLLFFITSRPENTVQLSLKKYNPCVRICAGNVEYDNFYQQHEQDIKLFLRNNVDFSRLTLSVDDLVTKCSGSFLYAFYIAEDLNAPMQSGKSFQLVDDRFPGNFDNFLRKNFKRVFDKVGSSLFKKLFGCAIAAPAPLPVSFISYILQREKWSMYKQHVLDALSLFMVSSKTFAFLHNLIPEWLTDEDKARELFIDRNTGKNYLKDVILELLFRFVHQQSQGVPFIEPDFLDYIPSFGLHFLPGFPWKDSWETVFSCLTSFKYIEKRIQSKIEIYSLIKDFEVAADCQFYDDGKKEILREVCLALERNIFVLSECPHFLHSCLQDASKVVQDNVVIPAGVSTTRLQCNSRILPARRQYKPCIGAPSNEYKPLQWSNFAKSPDGKMLAHINRHGKNIVFFDSCSLEVIYDIIVERYSDLVLGNNCLEFSPDGKFLFFGRLDCWLSVETGKLEEFPQFSGNEQTHVWGSFSLDRKWIVVKRGSFRPFLSNERCCSWCLLHYICLWAAEEITHCQESETICSCFPGRMAHLSDAMEYNTNFPAMTNLLNVLGRTHHNEWCHLLKMMYWDWSSRRIFQKECRYCTLRRKCETPSLTDLRDFIITHYSRIFLYQVWNLQTGRSALEQAFSSGVQMSPFNYFCHLRTALERCGNLFSGIDKELSLCNIALLITVCQCCTGSEVKSIQKFSFQEAFHVSTKTLTNTLLELQNLPDVKEEKQFTSIFPCVSPDGKWVAFLLDGYQTVHLCEADHLYEEVHVYTVHLYQNKHSLDWENPVHVIKKVVRFAFTYNSAFLLYLTFKRSLHSLSLATGSILTSVSDEIPLSFFPERQAGYRFQGDDEENIIFLNDFSSGFLRQFFVPAVKEIVQVAFASADIILVLYSNWRLVAMKTVDHEGCIVSETPLRPLDFHQRDQVTKGQFSPDGKLIVTHESTKILLYRTMLACTDDYGKRPGSIFETNTRFNSHFPVPIFQKNEEFIVLHFTFSADSTLLLFCIRRSSGVSFFVWNVQEKVLSASFDSPKLTSEDRCFCFSSNNTELIICSGFYIEFWDHSSHPCRLLRRVETGKPYTEVYNLTHSALSPENDLLAYCSADRILLCSLEASTDQSIRPLPCAHLGKVEFCQFLKGNRYLVSYGVDGTVFLWDLSEWKAIAFIKIAQGRESIVSMAVSAEGDKVVCVTSFGRLNVVKLCGLKDAMLSKLPLSKGIGSEKTTEAFRGKVRELTDAIQNLQCPDNTEDLYAAELQTEEMEFESCSDDNEYSDEDSHELLD